MHVLLVGGTGFVGSALARELHDRGHAVTVLARTPDDASLPDGIRTVAGDVTDYDSIEAAFEGQDVVVNLVALSPLFQPPGGAGMHERVHLGGTENVVEAAEAHGVDRLVQVSALGADPDGPTAYIRAKGAAEAVVRSSSLEWTVVRPSVVFGDGGEFVTFTKKLTTPYVTGLPGGGKTRFQPIWVGDLAPMLADCAVEHRHVGEVYELGGPEVLTLAEVASLAYRADGRSVAVLPVPMPLARIGLTLADVVPGIPMGVDQYRSLKFDNTVAENDVAAFGRSPGDLRTLAAYLGVSEPDRTDAEQERRAAPDGGGRGGTRTDTASAVTSGLLAWAVVVGVVLAAGLVTGIWVPGDVSAHADELLSFFGLQYLATTVLLVGGPVAVYRRYGLVTPLLGLLVYFGVWVVYGVSSGFGGVRSLYIAFLYGGFGLVGLVVVGLLESVLRALLPGRSRRPNGNGNGDHANRQ